MTKDHRSQQLWGGTFCPKAPPVNYLNKWLLQYDLDDSVKGRCVHLDPSGDLGGCTAIIDLFESAAYKAEVTTTDSSHMNGPVEHLHQTIGDAMHAMLGGADVRPWFWPYSFHHFICLYNVTLHCGSDKTPYEICLVNHPNLRHLHTFSCHVYAIPNRPCRDAKAVSDTRVGIFLGFSKTMKKIIYYDIESETVKEGQHVWFDEGMNDLLKKPPNACLLDGIRAQGPDMMKLDVSLPALDVSSRTFIGVHTIVMPFDLTDDAPLGFEFDRCPHLHRAHVSRVLCCGTGTKHWAFKTFKQGFQGAYVVKIDDTPIFSLDDVAKVMTCLGHSHAPPTTVELTLVLCTFDWLIYIMFVPYSH